jgi:hypothetical protein
MTNRIANAAVVAAGRWRWRKARSLADLANLQADRIARNLAELADDDNDPKWSMYSVLVALGRRGVVVADWRPGTSTDVTEPGAPMETRACVTGFADTETKNRLDDLLYHAGLEPGATKYELASVFELYGPGCEEYDRFGGDDGRRNPGRSWVERIGGIVTARIGGQMNAHQVYRAFPTRRSVQQELQKAWQITICAPTWGNDYMWADLLRLLYIGSRSATAPTEDCPPTLNR